MLTFVLQLVKVRSLVAEHSGKTLDRDDLEEIYRQGRRIPSIMGVITTHGTSSLFLPYQSPSHVIAGTDLDRAPHSEALRMIAPQRPQFYTTQWLEMCIQSGKILESYLAVCYRPLPFKYDIF